MAKLHECSSCERIREPSEMEHGVCKPCRTIAALRQEVGRLRAVFRVNMLRYAPAEGVDAEIDRVLNQR